MHCFVLGWNIPPGYISSLRREVGALASIYETLAPQTLWSWQSGPLAAASIQSTPEHHGIRYYRTGNEDEFTFLDGVCVNPEQRFQGFDARDIARNWSSLPTSVEGQFILARGQFKIPSLEIITDALGIAQLYCTRVQQGWLLSNSVHAIRRISAQTDLDPFGVASFVAKGWCAGASTLTKDIRCLPGGQHWRWTLDSAEPVCKTYFGRRDLLNLHPRRLTSTQVSSLASGLLDIVRPLRPLGELECPITAGRDSRVMAALLWAADLPTRFFSEGSEGDPDLEIGKSVAARFGLRFQPLADHEFATDAHWEQAIRRLLQQTDGMVTLAHVANALRADSTPKHRLVHFYGAGGEIARANFFQTQPSHYLLPPNRERAVATLQHVIVDCRGNLLRPDALNLVRQHHADYVDGMLKDGFSLRELEALYYLEERVHRWAGNNFRQVTSIRDVFSPFCTRLFAEAAFKVPYMLRFADHIHYELLGHLNSEMQQHPFETPWYPQQRTKVRQQLLRQCYDRSHIARIVRRVQNRIQPPKVFPSRQLQRASWLEQFLPLFRQSVLDQDKSPLWDYIDRVRLEHLLKPRTPSGERRKNLTVLFDAITVFHYQTLCQEKSVPHQDNPPVDTERFVTALDQS